MSKRKLVDFAAVKASVTLEQVLDRYGLTAQMKRGSDSLSGRCPIHQGENPTEFRVSLSKNCWNCFSSCHCGGNVIDFVAKMENVSFVKAAQLLAEWFQIEVQWRQDSEPPQEVPVKHSPKAKPPAPKSRVTAIDINRTACHMAFINTTLWGIPTRVIHGNSLSLECWAAWSNIHWLMPWLPLGFTIQTAESTEQGQPPKPVEIESLNAALVQQEWSFG